MKAIYVKEDSPVYLADIKVSFGAIAQVCGSRFAHQYVGADCDSVSIVQILSDLKFLSNLKDS